MLVGLDEGVERAFDDGLRHPLAIDERLVGPVVLGLVADIRNLRSSADAELRPAQTIRDSGGKASRTPSQSNHQPAPR